MSGRKAGSDGQIRKTSTEWATDTKTYPEGMRLMDVDTGVVRVSKGTTYALAWTPSAGGASTSDDVSNESRVDGATVTDALGNLDDADTALGSRLNDSLTMGYWNHAANSNAGNCTIAADGCELHPSNTNGEDHSTLFGNYANQTVQVVIRQENTHAYRVLTGTVTSTGGKLTGTGMTVGVTNGTFTVNNPTAVSITRTEVVKTYSAIIREQLGTDPPLPDNEVNRTGLTPTYGYNAAGDYYISMPGLPADQGKVKCQMTNGTNPGFYSVYYLGDEETIQIMTWNTSGVAANDILANASLEIKIDP